MLFIRKNVTSATQVTEVNTLDQITGKVIDVNRTHILLKALMIPLKRVKLRGASEPVFKHNQGAPAFTTKMWSWVVV